MTYITRVPYPALRRQNVLELPAGGRSLLDRIAMPWVAVDATLLAAHGKNADAIFAQAYQLRLNSGGAFCFSVIDQRQFGLDASVSGASIGQSF